MNARKREEAAEQERADPGLEAEAPDPAIAELARLRAREDELLRALAEQQNVNRRRRQEMDAAVIYAQEDLMREILPVLDDFERALKAMEGKAGESILSGIGMIYDRLVRILEKQGVTPIRPQGVPFDPALHEAVAEQAGTGATPGTIVEVVQPGYRFRDRVLRHAKVIVAGPSGTAAPETTTPSGAPR
ncbi:MAG: nucleotide exchange factor GrpE [Candidatus Eisenbacteria bacterium]|uniref:Protein GrpE n=1 Tax=Eiseniibacteriota bacterium TaxID=2212470 RepID=A0A538TST7_UNCEI|nr:MAG: nucleotide exchange factor GrpE [Candidatus Eisenbacteria bacterium]